MILATAVRHPDSDQRRPTGDPRSPRALFAGLSAVLAMLFVLPVVAMASELESLRVREAPDYTRVVFDVSAPVEFSIFKLDNPRRVVIDMRDTRAAPSFDPAAGAANTERVTAVRAAPRGSGVRVVLEVNGDVDPKGFSLSPAAPYGHRLVVDLHGEGAGSTTVAGPSQPKTRSKARRDVVVAIDAGHGGEDPGALGPGGLLEKDVVMQIARRIERKLAAAPGYKPVMVRTGDYYLAHRKRFAVARNAGADLFVSIHADAFMSPKVYGASVYALSKNGASRETQRWLAGQNQNLELLGGEERISLQDQNQDVVGILVELSASASMAASLEVGSSILERMAPITKLHKKRVEQAGFLVLKALDVPSVLVETGFISNPQEARRLGSTDFQNKMATAISDGIRNFMAANPPDGTLLAWQRQQGGQKYTISRGDTLSEIASRHGVTTRRIKEANGMSSDVIRVGQVITIPAG